MTDGINILRHIRFTLETCQKNYWVPMLRLEGNRSKWMMVRTNTVTLQIDRSTFLLEQFVSTLYLKSRVMEVCTYFQDPREMEAKKSIRSTRLR